MDKKKLYEKIMRNVSREVKRALNNHLLEAVDQSLLTKAAKISDDEIELLKRDFDESDFGDLEILRKLQRRRRQTKAFNQRIEELNDEAVAETTGRLKEIIEKWRDPIDLGDGVTVNIGFEVEEEEIIRTAEIHFPVYLGGGYEPPVTDEPEYYYRLYVYITNDNFEETTRKVISIAKNVTPSGNLGFNTDIDIDNAKNIDIQINRIQERLLNDLKAIGYELYKTDIVRKSKNNVFSGMKCLTLSYKKGYDVNARLLKGLLNKDDKNDLRISRKSDNYTGFYGDNKDMARINDKIKRTKRRL